MTFPTPGPFVLSDGSQLPNVTVAFPGEHWSNRKAGSALAPGDAVVGYNSATPTGNQLFVRRAAASDNLAQVGIALQVVSPPDINIGSIYNPVLGPNEIVNRVLNPGDYVHVYYGGVFHLTTAQADATYGPGDLIGWDPAATRPTGKPQPIPAGSTSSPYAGGTWRKGAPVGPLFEVMEFRAYGGAAVSGEGILTVRTLRSQS